MATNETFLNLAGQLTANPKVVETRSGTMVKLRVASTSRFFDRSESQWRDGGSIFLDVTCWRRLAENAAATLEKGDRVLIFGRLRQRSFEDAQGVRHTVNEVDADALGPDLSRFPAKLQRRDANRPSDTEAGPSEPAQPEAPAAAA